MSPASLKFDLITFASHAYPFHLFDGSLTCSFAKDSHATSALAQTSKVLPSCSTVLHRGGAACRPPASRQPQINVRNTLLMPVSSSKLTPTARQMQGQLLDLRVPGTFGIAKYVIRSCGL